jgi:hypothetical protein
MIATLAPFIAVSLFWIMLPVGVIYFARRVLRALERRSVSEGQISELSDRLRRMEERIEEVASDTARLEESQRFTTAILSSSLESSRQPQGQVSALRIPAGDG